MRANVKAKAKTAVVTHEGAPAVAVSTEAQLRRTLMSCLLWEKEAYEDGQEIGKRLIELAEKVPPRTLAALAMEARHTQHLRHAPLLLLCVLARTGKGSRLVQDTVAGVISRADEMGEFLSIYASVNGVAPNDPKGGLRKKMSVQVRKGLARAFQKFDAYQLGKYNRDGLVKMRDVLFLTHPKPIHQAQAAIWKQLVDGTLEAPDTWEVALSTGADKKATFERLIRDRKIGYLALLRNLRNMEHAGVDEAVVRQALLDRRGGDRVLPFRYVAAARACPAYERPINVAMLKSLEGAKELPGKTVILVDVSSSMHAKLSHKSDLSRQDAAAALAAIVPGDNRVFCFNTAVAEVPARPGLAGVDAINACRPGPDGTNIGVAVAHANSIKHDRLIVVTDEQSHDRVGKPNAKHAYMINVASARNGVGYGPEWTHIDGWSENVIRFIYEMEGL